MADVYKKNDARSLLRGKHILFIGDSNIRALYKDLVWLTNFNSLIGLNFLKRRLEDRFLGDRLLERSELTRGRDFTEHRIFKNDRKTIEFIFVTRCYCDNLKKHIKDIVDGKANCPDVILMNSCLWDVSRWGPNGVTEYKSNMDKLMKLISSSLPKKVLFIWATALPIATITSGGLLIKQIEFLQAMIRIHVIEASAFTAALVSSYGFDVLDFHHYMRYQIIRRSADGVHFLPPAMRFLTNLLLTHVALSWDIKLPRNLKTFTLPLAMKIQKALEVSPGNGVEQALHKIELLADSLNTKMEEKSKETRKKKKICLTKYNEAQPYQSKTARPKIPSNYFHASSFSKARIPSRKIPNNQPCSSVWESFVPNIKAVPDRQVRNSIQCSDGLLSYGQYPTKDFRLNGFNDYCQSSSSSNTYNQHSNYEDSKGAYDGNYARGFLENYTLPQYNILESFQRAGNILSSNHREYNNYNYDRSYNYDNRYDRKYSNDHFSCYENHPYKPSQGKWQPWDRRETYEDPGPMRQRIFIRYQSAKRY